ncbi:uncharacterized protein RJT21DRAFT_121727 [Scheffersomyces amazonensis]|uniref:uncharacterized protein n=1 Tax=Scheffersomyces amazonensis TaxID=1078765 RepID=UPI00315CD836
MAIGQLLTRSRGKSSIDLDNQSDTKVADIPQPHKNDKYHIKKSPSMNFFQASRSIITKLTTKNQPKLLSPVILSSATLPTTTSPLPQHEYKLPPIPPSSTFDYSVHNIVMPNYNYKTDDTTEINNNHNDHNNHNNNHNNNDDDNDDKSIENSIQSTNTLKDMIRESSIYKFEDNESMITRPLRQTPSTPEQNILPDITETPIFKATTYSNKSIFGNLDAISFDDNILSRSTSRQDSLFLKTEVITDMSSIKDVSIQVYKSYATTNPASLKIIKQQEDLALSILSDEEDNENSSNRATFRISHASEPGKVENQIYTSDFDIISNYGQYEPINDSQQEQEVNDIESDTSPDGEFYFNDSQKSTTIYNNEMKLLSERQKLIIDRQQSEIDYLKQLLFEERKLNNYLATSNNSSPSLKKDNDSIKSRKVRSKFLPINITSGELSTPSTKPFNLQPPDRSDYDLDDVLDKYHSSESIPDHSFRKPSFASSVFSEVRSNSPAKDTANSLSSSYTIPYLSDKDSISPTAVPMV